MWLQGAISFAGPALQFITFIQNWELNNFQGVKRSSAISALRSEAAAANFRGGPGMSLVSSFAHEAGLSWQIHALATIDAVLWQVEAPLASVRVRHPHQSMSCSSGQNRE